MHINNIWERIKEHSLDATCNDYTISIRPFIFIGAKINMTSNVMKLVFIYSFGNPRT